MAGDSSGGGPIGAVLAFIFGSVFRRIIAAAVGVAGMTAYVIQSPDALITRDDVQHMIEGDRTTVRRQAEIDHARRSTIAEIKRAIERNSEAIDRLQYQQALDDEHRRGATQGYDRIRAVERCCAQLRAQSSKDKR